MKILRPFLLALGIAFVTLGIYVYFYLGLWKSVEVRYGLRPSLWVVGASHLGPYHKVADLINSVEKSLRDSGYSCDKTFGAYLDDPRVLEEVRLRAFAGCLLSDEEAVRWKTQHSVPGQENPDKTDKSGDTPSATLALHKLKASERVLQATFDGAPSAGPLKVYPAAEKELKGRNYLWSLEVYRVRDSKVLTEYYFETVPWEKTSQIENQVQ